MLGYTFCFLTMDKSHELQLMLVNTLRKVDFRIPPAVYPTIIDLGH